jgi:CheY-like chemotaxis protein
MSTRLVMVVDDDEDIRDMIALVLQTAGCGVVTACDGTEALTHLRAGPMPCLVFLDLMMPGMNGWELCDAIHADEGLKGLTVLLVSGAADVEESARRMGVAGALVKPFDAKALLRSVEEYC